MFTVEELLISVEVTAQEDLSELAKRLYAETYVEPGAQGTQTHDEEPILFLADRCGHAFKTSPRFKWSPRSKDYWCPRRIERVKWIGAVVSRQVPGVQCRYGYIEVDGVVCERRLYSVDAGRDYLGRPEFYVVWLEPRAKGGYRFSSAYLCTLHDVRRYASGLKRDIALGK